MKNIRKTLFIFSALLFSVWFSTVQASTYCSTGSGSRATNEVCCPNGVENGQNCATYGAYYSWTNSICQEETGSASYSPPTGAASANFVCDVNHGRWQATSCNYGYALCSGTCITPYCANGTPVSSSCSNECASCYGGYTLCSGSCVQTTTAPSGCSSFTVCGGCTACDSGYMLLNGSCTSLNSYWVLSGSSLYPSSTSYNTGLGTNNPGSIKLSVVGDIAGSESLKISNSSVVNFIAGSLGVGNAGGGSSKLSIFGNQSIGTGYFSNSAPTNGLIVEGNVGIGITNPGAKLDIGGGITSNLQAIFTRGSSDNNFRLAAYNGSGTTTNSEHAWFGMDWNGAKLAGISFVRGGGANAWMNFQTGVGSNAMTIDNSGFVGMGTTAPKTQLHLVGASADQRTAGGDYTNSIRLTDKYATANGSGGELQFGYAETGINAVLSTIKGTYDNWGATSLGGGLHFYTKPQDGSLAERLTVKYDGNVGVGVANPNVLLEVAGSDAQTTPGNSSKALRITNTSDGYLATAEIQFGGKPNAKAAAIGFQNLNGINNTAGDLFFATRNNTTDTNLTEQMRIKQDGKVGIGTTSPAYKLDVAGGGRFTEDLVANSFTYSDRTLKKNITTIDNPINKISQLRGVTFNWKKDDRPGVGVIAQELEKVYPELVNTDASGIKSVQYSSLVAPLIEAVKAQQKEINNLEARILILEKRK